MLATAADIGPVYDLLLATRDGSTLPCKNAQGTIVNLSQLAYCTSVNRQNEVEEATELQHKATVTQLASPNISDREIEQWPQVSQGDWSGGMAQKIFGSGSPADATRYWDGIGVLWPLTDVVPQRLLPMGGIKPSGNDTLTYQGNAWGASAGQLFATIYDDQTSSKKLSTELSALGTTVVDWTAVLPLGSGVGAFLGFQGRWWAFGNNTTIATAAQGSPAAATSFATTPSSGGPGLDLMAAGAIGSQSYLAVVVNGSAGTIHSIRLYNITSQTSTPSNNAFVDLNLDFNSQIQDLCFLGDNLYISYNNGVSGGGNSYIVAYNVPNQQFTVVAAFPNSQQVYIAPVAGTLFCLARSQNPSTSFVTAEMFLLQGTQLQDIGPVTAMLNTTLLPVLVTSKVTSYGPYAIFYIYTSNPGFETFMPYFYDVLRGRLFKGEEAATESSAFNLDGLRPVAWTNAIQSYGNVPGMASSFQILRPSAVAATGSGTVSGSTPLVWNWAINPYNTNFPPSGIANRTGLRVTSGLIDFGSSEKKLFRELRVDFTALTNDASCTVTLNAWLDQDPTMLSSSPQFTATIAGNVSPGATKLYLPVNKIGVKLVYQLVIAGGTATAGGSTSFPASIPISVAIRLSTGWVWNVVLDLAPNVIGNGKGPDTIWDRQGTGGQTIDNVAAYNFLRQLWRLQGGRLQATWPNGDSYPALLQSISNKSPKPFALSTRSDMPSQLQMTCSITIREDIG